MNRPLEPVLMNWDEIISVTDAVQRTGRSEATIRPYCRRHGIARQSCSNAPLEISLIGLEMVLHGDIEALEALRDGRRSEPNVERYLRHLGFIR